MGCLLAACIAIPVGLPSVIIGMFIKLHHPELNSIDTLPFFLCNYLPEWLGGAGLAALVLVLRPVPLPVCRLVWARCSAAIFSGRVLKVHDSKKLLWINKLTVLAVTLAALGFYSFASRFFRSAMELSFNGFARCRRFPADDCRYLL